MAPLLLLSPLCVHASSPLSLAAGSESDKVLTAFDGALQKAAVSSLTERRTKLVEEGLIEVCAVPCSNLMFPNWHSGKIS